MTITVDWPTGLITVPQSDLIPALDSNDEPIPGFFVHDMEIFRRDLRRLEATSPGMPWPKTHTRFDPYRVAGVTYPQGIEIINGYRVEYEDGQYVVNLQGGNNNVIDDRVVNRVSINPSNAAAVSTTQIPADVMAAQIAPAVWELLYANHADPGSFGALVQDTNAETGRIKRLAQAILGLVASRRS